MANKAIKEYDDFVGQDGYLIVDGLTDNESGGKMKVPNYSGVTDGYVLTKTTTDGTDDIVWSAPAGGSIVPSMDSLIGKLFNGAVADAPFVDEPVEFRLYGTVTTDANCNIISVSGPKWQCDCSQGSGNWYDL